MRGTRSILRSSFIYPKNEIEDKGLSKVDWFLFVVLGGICFLSFAHEDIVLTGNRSWLFYEGGILDFYDRSVEWTGSYDANYMPSTFWLFAIWNLPLKLLGRGMPTTITESRLIYVMWYKLLPVIFYMASGYLVYRIAVQVGLGEKRGKLCMYAFLTCPVAFFSQLIFSQYDAFAVFFMLWGMLYYFRDKKNDKWRSCILFGIAVTFKYFALLIFAILILLDEKNVWKIVKYVLVMAVPFVLEFLPYAGSVGFQKGVLGFHALGFIEQEDFSTALDTVSFCKTAVVLLAIWAYFVKPKDAKERLDWALYLCCGMCFVLFGLMTWNPQWLIFAAPFWVLSAFTNKNTEKFLWLELLLIPVFYTFVTNTWVGAVDETMLTRGIWKYLVAENVMQHRALDFMLPVDTSTLYSILVALFLAFFLFKHPKYARDELQQDHEKSNLGLIRVRLIASALLFIIPTGACLVDAIVSDYVQIGGGEDWRYTAVTPDQKFEQTIVGLEGELDSVYPYLATYMRENNSQLGYELWDASEGTMLVNGTANALDVKDNAYFKLDCKDVYLQADHQYLFTLYSLDATTDTCIALRLGKDEDINDQNCCIINGAYSDENYCMLLKFN